MAYNYYITKIYAAQYAALKIYNLDKFVNVLQNTTKRRIELSYFISYISNTFRKLECGRIIILMLKSV